MNWLVISGIRPYDGRYEFDLEGREFNTREWGWIKRMSGYLPLTIDNGFEGGDPELFAVFAVIVLERAGRITSRDAPDVFARISEAPFGSAIRLETDDISEDEAEGDDAGPPASSSNGNEHTSGGDSKRSSVNWDGTPTNFGTHASDSSESSPTESVTTPRRS